MSVSSHVENQISFDGADDWNIWTYDNSDIITELLLHVKVAPNGYKWIGGQWNAAKFLGAGYTVSVLDDFDERVGVSLFPNPSNGVFQIKTNSDVHIRQVELIDIQGKVLRTWGGGKSTYDIGKFDNGIYILRINLGGTYTSARILKQ